MPTRKESQICEALIKLVDLVHDGLDCIMFCLRNLDEQTGTPRNLSIEEIKTEVSGHISRMINRRNYINSFVSQFGAQNVADALTACNFTVTDVVDSVENMRTIAQYVSSNLADVQDYADAETLAQYIENNHEVLVVFRRPWLWGG